MAGPFFYYLIQTLFFETIFEQLNRRFDTRQSNFSLFCLFGSFFNVIFAAEDYFLDVILQQSILQII